MIVTLDALKPALWSTTKIAYIRPSKTYKLFLLTHHIWEINMKFLELSAPISPWLLSLSKLKLWPSQHASILPLISKSLTYKIFSIPKPQPFSQPSSNNSDTNFLCWNAPRKKQALCVRHKMDFICKALFSTHTCIRYEGRSSSWKISTDIPFYCSIMKVIMFQSNKTKSIDILQNKTWEATATMNCVLMWIYRNVYRCTRCS